MATDRARAWLRRLAATVRGGGLPVWAHADYRLPIGGLEAVRGVEPRRADYALSAMLELGVLREADVRQPERASYAELARVHTPAWLEALGTAEALALIYGVPAAELPVDALMNMARLATGGTVAAARVALARRGPTLNLLGGFHHAAPGKGGGLCAINDVAVAIAALRADGFDGQVAVLDLDAHPPDGTAACLAEDSRAWIGSISGSDWGPLPGVDETLLVGADDATYLDALHGLLDRMPRPDLAFVLAGGDVLRGDALGRLGLSLGGARERDLAVIRALRGAPSVWLPAGGYHRDAWRLLAGTGLALSLGSEEPVPTALDPLTTRFAQIYKSLHAEALGKEDWLTAQDLDEALGKRGARSLRLLGYYTAEGAEYALHRYGVLAVLDRMGFTGFRVAISRIDVGERFQLFARSATDLAGPEQLLVEAVLDRERVSLADHPGLIAGQEADGARDAAVDILYVHWLNLRNPRASFSADRPPLPGQDVPGLGLAEEAGRLLKLIALRLQLDGVALRPAWFHVAWASRYGFRFLDPERQGRFEALMADLARVPVLELTMAIAEGRARLNGAPYAWEADLMVQGIEPSPEALRRAAAERARCRFALADAAPEDAALKLPDGREGC